MMVKPEPIPADPDDAEDFDASAAEVGRALLCREVRQLRAASCLTQNAFADRFGLALGTLRDWEQGRASPPIYAVAFLRLALSDDGAASSEVSRLRALVA